MTTPPSYIDEILDKHEYRTFATKVDDSVFFSIPHRVMLPVPKFTTILYNIQEDGLELCFYDNNENLVYDTTITCNDIVKICIIIMTIFLICRELSYNTDYILCNNEDGDDISFYEFGDSLAHEYMLEEETYMFTQLFSYGCTQATPPPELSDDLKTLNNITDTLKNLIVS